MRGTGGLCKHSWPYCIISISKSPVSNTALKSRCQRVNSIRVSLQIRAQLAAENHPLFADTLYNSATLTAAPQVAMHSSTVTAMSPMLHIHVQAAAMCMQGCSLHVGWHCSCCITRPFCSPTISIPSSLACAKHCSEYSIQLQSVPT